MGSLRDGCFRLVLYDWGVVGKDPGRIFERCLALLVSYKPLAEFWLPALRAVAARSRHDTYLDARVLQNRSIPNCLCISVAIGGV